MCSLFVESNDMEACSGTGFIDICWVDVRWDQQIGSYDSNGRFQPSHVWTYVACISIPYGSSHKGVRYYGDVTFVRHHHAPSGWTFERGKTYQQAIDSGNGWDDHWHWNNPNAVSWWTHLSWPGLY